MKLLKNKLVIGSLCILLGLLRDSASAVGQYANADLYAGDYLTAAKLSQELPERSLLSAGEAKGKTVPGTEPPLYVWSVSPGVSGMAFYSAPTFPQWQHKLFIGALKDQSLIVLKVDGDKVREEARILGERGKRIRDVRVGPDGYLYVLTDESNGELLKVSPAD